MTTSKPKIPFHVDMKFTHGEPRKIWPGVRRIVANNPGPLTHNGTNTYIVGEGRVAVIDPGPDDDDHIDAIMRAIKAERLDYILLTHTHKDHSTSIPKLKELTGAKLVAYAPIHENRGCRRDSEKPLDAKFVDFEIKPDTEIVDGDILEGTGWALKAVHTPGHAPDHLCYAHQTEPILFTGDHIMAWNTSVIIPPEGRMSDYLVSLKKCLNNSYERLMPGHGGQAQSPDRLIKAYLMHRKWREEAVLTAITSGMQGIDELLPALYPNIDEGVKGAAALSILAHAVHLCEQGVIKADTCKFALNTNFEPK